MAQDLNQVIALMFQLKKHMMLSAKVVGTKATAKKAGTKVTKLALFPRVEGLDENGEAVKA